MATSTPVIYCLSTVPGIHNPQSKAPGSPHPISDLAEAVRCAHRQRRMCGGARMTFVDIKHQCRQQSRSAWNEIHRELLGQVKLCSCHFARDGFAQPQHVL